MKSFYDKAYLNNIIVMSVDIETKDIRSSAQVLSIGAVIYEIPAAYEPNAFEFGKYKELDSFYVNIDPDTYPKNGKFTSGKETMDWWFTQPEAFAQLGPNRRPAADAFSEFYQFYYQNVSDETPALVVGKPSHFDIPILENGLRHVKGQMDEFGKVPWKHYEVFCLRTFLQQTRFDQNDIPFEGTQHNALDDARWQARVHTAAQVEFLKKLSDAEKWADLSSKTPVSPAVPVLDLGNLVADPIGETPPPAPLPIYPQAPGTPDPLNDEIPF